MEILNNKKQPSAALRAMAFAGLVLVLCAAIAYLALRQRNIERYGKPPVADTHQQAIASLEKKSGTVTVGRHGTLDDQALQTGDSLFAGDRIQTGDGAHATLALAGGTRLTLEQNSLLQLPEKSKNKKRKGSVLHLTEGSFHLDSEELGDDILALSTPQTFIDLNTRDLVLLRPEPGGRTDIAYLKSLAASWFPDSNTQAFETAAQTVERAIQACTIEDENTCAAAADRAWRNLLDLRRSSAGRKHVVLNITIDDSGEEKIAVANGAITVKTNNRTLMVAQGEDLNLDGSMPTRKTMTAETLLALVPQKPEPEIIDIPEPEVEPFFEIESIHWQ